MSNINIPTQVSPFVNRSQFPALGKTRVIYIDQTANVAYYWNNTSNAYVELGAAVAVNWGDITGTLADQTDLQNALDDLVPYSGATQDVNLGEHDLSVRKIFLYDEPNGNFGSIHYTDGNFHIEDADGHKLFVVEDGFLQLHLTDTIQSNLFLTLLTQTRDHYLPNQSGTIALTSDITGINSGTNTGDETTASIKTKLGITTLSGSNTGDQDLSGLTPKTRTISTTAPLTGGGDLTADRTLSIPQATTAVDGYLSAADWTIFNGKQNALGFTPVPDSRTLTINGVTQDLTANRTFTISTGITIGTTAITSGTVGRVLFEGTGNVVSESANLFWDNTNARLGVGTSSPSEKLEIVSGAIQLSNAQGIRSRYTGGAAFTILQMFSDNNTYLDGANDILFRVAAGATTAMRLKSATGNVLINTTTDAGYQLDVNGTARVSGALTVGGTQLFFNGAFYNTINDRNHFGGAVSISTFLRVGTNANTVASAILQADSTTKGFLPPRQTQAQRTAIASPAVGLQVYQTDGTEGLYIYKSTGWALLL